MVMHVTDYHGQLAEFWLNESRPQSEFTELHKLE